MHLMSPARCRQDALCPRACFPRRKRINEKRPGSGLPRDREIELATRIQAGDLDARRELVEANLRLAWKVAGRYRRLRSVGIDLDDLKQFGVLGLFEAADRFDPLTYGTRFSTQACPWIRKAILEGVRDQGRLIRVPAHLWDAGIAAERAIPVGPLAFDPPDYRAESREPFDHERFDRLMASLSPKEAGLILHRLQYHSPENAKAPGRPNGVRHQRTMAACRLVKRLRQRVQREEGASHE
jgi:RNA polymerase sigma factor (sigma-70 family)